jgi:glycosyltransferase 2 family protein
MNSYSQCDAVQELERLVETDSSRVNQQFFRKIVTVSMVIGIAVSMAIAGWNLFQLVDWMSLRAVWTLPIAFAMAIIYRVVNAYGWAIVLRSLGANAKSVAAIRVWLLAESSRWLPGSVWGYVSRASLANSIGVTTSIAVASMLVEILLVIAAAGLVAIVGCYYFWDQLIHNIHAWSNGLSFLIAVGCLAACITAFLLKRRMISKKFRGVLSKLTMLQEMQLHYKTIWLAFAFFVMMNVFNGGISWIVSLSVSESQRVPVLAIVCATAAAWLVGFFAIFSPGGLVVRETAFAAMLLVWMPYSESIAIAILARLLQFGAEAFSLSWIALERFLSRPSQ